MTFRKKNTTFVHNFWFVGPDEPRLTKAARSHAIREVHRRKELARSNLTKKLPLGWTVVNGHPNSKTFSSSESRERSQVSTDNVQSGCPVSSCQRRSSNPNSEDLTIGTKDTSSVDQTLIWTPSSSDASSPTSLLSACSTDPYSSLPIDICKPNSSPYLPENLASFRKSTPFIPHHQAVEFR
jgi:hypothetical protein